MQTRLPGVFPFERILGFRTSNIMQALKERPERKHVWEGVGHW